MRTYLRPEFLAELLAPPSQTNFPGHPAMVDFFWRREKRKLGTLGRAAAPQASRAANLRDDK
jgi:hypothetical protein